MKGIFLVKMNNFQLVIKLFILLIFLGYAMIWIMMPTNVFWLHWLSDIHAKTDSSYFGQQGSITLLQLMFFSTRNLVTQKGRIYQISNKYSCLIIFAGANILIYSFPVLLVAALGCLYLQLEKYIDRSKDEYVKLSLNDMILLYVVYSSTYV